jgi:hypothetical protein
MVGLIIYPDLLAQSITPSTINNGGGFSTTLEWSIGESASIANLLALPIY